MEEHPYRIQKSVRYITIGAASSKVRNLWVCLHGYGQLAYGFAKRFENQKDEQRLILIPEGPNHFYLHGTEGRVGASWMTKENRLADIEDQFDYLEGLVSNVLNKLSSDCKVHVFGFSQGVSTAFRWLIKSNLAIRSLVCWAGSFPPEINYTATNSVFSQLFVSTCFGDEDEFISTNNALRLMAMLEDAQINVHKHFYQGGHRVYESLLNEVIEEHETQ